MQRVIDHRKISGNRGKFAPLEADHWMNIFQVYEEEVGMQYPFIDLGELRRTVQAVESNTYGPNAVGEFASLEDMATLILAVVSSLADPDTVDVANDFVGDLFGAALVRTQLTTANKTDMTVVILCVCLLLRICLSTDTDTQLQSIFYFLTDREIIAWRAIGNVLRSCHEIISQYSLEAPAPSSLDEIKDIGEKFYWSVYTLDRRWGFGTALPFAVPDSDIHRLPNIAVSFGVKKRVVIIRLRC